MPYIKLGDNFRPQLKKMHSFVCDFSKSYEGDKQEIGFQLLICFLMGCPEDISTEDLLKTLISCRSFVNNMEKEMEDDNR